METQKAEFIKLIDHAIHIAQEMQDKKSDNSSRLTNVIKVLKQTKNDVINNSLSASQGTMTLGLSREVADWVESLDSPLLTAVGQIEKYYQQEF